MKTYIRILTSLVIVLLTIGCSAQLSFDELTKDVPSDLDVHKYSSTKMNYSISLLKYLELAEKDYNNDTLGFEVFVDTSVVFEEGTSTLSVLKYNSTDTTLNGAWNKLMSNRPFENFRIYSEGTTDYLSRPAYYEHSAYTISEKNTETINFFFRGDSSDFYLMNLQVITEEGYPDNMKELLFCAKSLKILPGVNKEK